MVEPNSGICDSEILIEHIYGICDILVFKVIFESFGALLPNWPVTGKRNL